MSRFSVLVVVTVLCIGAATAYALPDIYGFGSSMTVSSMQIWPGDTLTASWKVYNNSTVGIPELPPPPQEFTTAYGPWDEAVFLGTTLLGTETFTGSLAPGAGYRFTKDFLVPVGLSPGNYSLRIMADYHNVLAEVDEGNNWSFFDHALTVLPEPGMALPVLLGGLLMIRRTNRLVPVGRAFLTSSLKR